MANRIDEEMRELHARLCMPPTVAQLEALGKPSVELIDGKLEPKALGSKRHARLQGILGRMLEAAGFRAYTELTLLIDEETTLIPDVAGLSGPETEGEYQDTPPDVVIEILSPSDRFVAVPRKCRLYAAWGVPQILVIDPVAEEAWAWSNGVLIPIEGGRYQQFDLAEAFRQAR